MVVEEKFPGGHFPKCIVLQTVYLRYSLGYRDIEELMRERGVDKEGNTIDGSAANKAAIKKYNSDKGTSIEIRQVKYLNNIVEQDHRGIKRITNSILGFKSFCSARITLDGIETVHMLRIMQLPSQNYAQNLAETFNSLAA